MGAGIYLAPSTEMHLPGRQEALHSVLSAENKIPHLQRKGTHCLQPQPHSQLHNGTSDGDATTGADPTHNSPSQPISSKLYLQERIPGLNNPPTACLLHKPVSQKWLLSVGSLGFLFLHSELKCAGQMPTNTRFKFGHTHLF